jgi:hypothetical protein
LIDNILKMTSCICNTLSSRFMKLSRTRRNRCWFMVAISSWIARFSSRAVCGRLLYTHSFKHRHRKKSETVRSGERTGHGIPDTGICPSSLVNTLHTPPTRCHSNGLTSLLIIHTNKCTFYNIMNSKIHIKIHIRTFKTLLHISILRSSSGSIHCSMLKLYIKQWVNYFVISTRWCGSMSCVCMCDWSLSGQGTTHIQTHDMLPHHRVNKTK